MTHLELVSELAILLALMIFAFYVLALIGIAGLLTKKLDGYRSRFGFNREIEASTMKNKNPDKINKRLDKLEQRFKRRQNAQLPRKENESLFAYIRRKLNA